jgi:hypothetical protein
VDWEVMMRNVSEVGGSLKWLLWWKTWKVVMVSTHGEKFKNLRFLSECTYLLCVCYRFYQQFVDGQRGWVQTKPAQVSKQLVRRQYQPSAGQTFSPLVAWANDELGGEDRPVRWLGGDDSSYTRLCDAGSGEDKEQVDFLMYVDFLWLCLNGSFLIIFFCPFFIWKSKEFVS